jgi:hypothetical protein
MVLSEAHRQKLQLTYGLPEERVRSLEDSGEICSLTPEEVRDHLGRTDIDSPGLLFKYPGNGATTIRLDNPPVKDGKPQKYLRIAGEPNHLFNPGVDLSQAQELWIVEGEAKALCGHAQALPIIGLSGVFNWRTLGPETELLAEGEKLKDEEALLPELAQVNLSGKKINLLYDSDIIPGHKAYDAFPRLAEQFYRLGAGEVRILSLPSLSKEQKTGLDEFILAKGPEQALQDLQAMKSRKEPYLPWRDGAVRYAERLIKSEDLEDKLNATIAYLGAKGKVFAQEWLKEHGIRGETKSALLQEAKEKLSQIQAKPRASSSSQGLPKLGPEYFQIKALIQPHAEEYALDELGRIGKIEWKQGFKDGKEVYEPVLKHICNFAAWPIREILKDSGNGTPERYLELQGLLQGGTPLKPAKISLPDFLEKNSWAGQLWGAKAGIKPNKEKDLRYVIQLMAREIPNSTIYSHLGWRKINDSWIYLHAGGAIGQGSETVEVEISDRLRKYSLPEETGDIKETLKASLSLLELGPKKIMYPLLALVYLAPLCESLRQAGIEPSLLSYIWGVSGTKKSTLIAILLSHFGSFEHTGLPASFRDTANSIEKLAFLAKDTVLAVDDLYPAREPKERAKLEGILEHLSRNQGDRTGKGRMRADTSLREGLPPRGLALCSGEIMPLIGSSLARSFVHKLQKGDIELKKLSQAQAQKILFPQVMKEYLEWLAPQMGDLPDQLKTAFTHLRVEATEKSTVKTRHSRLNEAISHLHLGLNTFCSFAVSQGALSQDEGKRILQEAWEIFNQIADEQALQEQAGEPSKKIAEASLELEAQGRIYWADMADTPGFLEGAVKVGWKDEERGIFYTNLGTLIKEVNQHLRGQGEFLSLSKADFITYLNQKELLVEKDKDKNQKTIWINDNSKERKARKTYAISSKFFSWEGEDGV